MLRRVIGLAVVGSLIVSSFACGGPEGSDEGAPQGGEQEPPPETQDVAPKNEADGAVTGGIAAGSDKTQLLRASAASAIAGAAVAFPPGALAVDVDVTVEQGVAFESAALAADLGAGTAAFAEAGPAVVVSANPPANASAPFSITLVLTPGAELTAGGIVVVYKTIDAITGAYKLGVLLGDEVVVDGNVITVRTTRFGLFQPMRSDLTTRVEVDTTKPIVTAREAAAPQPQPGDGDTTAPVLKTVAPAMGVTATSGTPIVLVFNEGMTTAGAQVTGDMIANRAFTAQLSKTQVDDDTVTLVPTAGWVGGKGRKLTVTLKDKAGNAAAATTLTYDVVEAIYYVRVGGSDVATSGSAQQPFATVAYAATKAAEKTNSIIHVAAGSYSGFVKIRPGMTVLGGYPAAAWANRDPAVNVTTLAGDINASPQATVHFDGIANNTNEAVLDGFTLDSPTPRSFWIVLQVDNFAGLARVERNVIKGAAINATYAVQITNSSVVLADNLISTSDTEDATEGVIVSTTSGTPKADVRIARNRILVGAVTRTSGPPTQSIGLKVTSSDATYATVRIHDNVITSGVSQISTGRSVAITTTNTVADIRNNTIRSKGAATASIGVEITGSTSSLNLDNNIIMTNFSSTEHCIASDSVDVIASLDNNDFERCQPPPAFNLLAGRGIMSIQGTEYRYLMDINGYATTGAAAAGNLDVTPGFLDSNNDDYRLNNMSALKSAGKNGKNANWNFGGIYKDAGGTTRGASWSIGAYQ